VFPTNVVDTITVATAQVRNFGKTISVYPNPASDYLTIKGEFSTGKIFTVAGFFVQEVPKNSKEETSLDISSFAAGMYLLQFSGEHGEVATVKLFVIH
jgi:hypothetical protein